MDATTMRKARNFATTAVGTAVKARLLKTSTKAIGKAFTNYLRRRRAAKTFARRAAYLSGISVAAGAAAGAFAMYLFDPVSGPERRTRLLQGANRASEQFGSRRLKHKEGAQAEDKRPEPYMSGTI